MPKFITNAEANMLRSIGRAKHLPDESRRADGLDGDAVEKSIAAALTAITTLNERIVSVLERPSPPVKTPMDTPPSTAPPPAKTKADEPPRRYRIERNDNGRITALTAAGKVLVVERDAGGKIQSIGTVDGKIKCAVERDDEGRIVSITKQESR